MQQAGRKQCQYRTSFGRGTVDGEHGVKSRRLSVLWREPLQWWMWLAARRGNVRTTQHFPPHMNHSAALRTLTRGIARNKTTPARARLDLNLGTYQNPTPIRPWTACRTMASIHIDDKVKSLIEKSYPQAKDAGEDAQKLSSAAFPSVEVRKSDH